MIAVQINAYDYMEYIPSSNKSQTDIELHVFQLQSIKRSSIPTITALEPAISIPVG